MLNLFISMHAVLLLQTQQRDLEHLRLHPSENYSGRDNQSISLLLALAVLKSLQRIRVVFAHSARPGI